MGTSVQTRRALMGGIGAFTVGLGLAPKDFGARALAASARTQTKKRNAQAEAASSPDGMAQTLLGPMPIPARWAYIIDVTTNTVLLEKASNERMVPSSLTKMMTAYIVFAFLAAGRLQLDQQLPVSEKAWRMQGSKMFVPLGKTVSVSDLIQGMVIQSGNDACIVLAEHLAGSEERFAVMMNEMGQRLGLTGSHFMNATGWPVDNHYMTAHDVGLLAAHLIRDFPQYYHFFNEKEFLFNHIRQGNRNVLVDKGLADGLKTGHTDAGGFGLCASSLRNGTRVIIVLNGLASSNQRAREGERLMSWAFSNFETVSFYKKGQVVEAQAPVWMGNHNTVSLIASQDIKMTLPLGMREKATVSADYPAPLMPPLKQGQPYGVLKITLPNGSSVPTEREYPLLIGTSVDALGFMGRILSRVGYGFGQ
ncbi:D-alanyl-D-alanine carboxypeptidase family protein [Aristophania vespae]|uniref:D-alanyl-D-alanine carboxypeptidase family protein n=1 Tax=Aristophania vespae TaxID=2697033 RepID=UPI0038CF43A6|nr:D-alanyl-D-alanine carboxypeptidase DacC [Aristophania vespae]